MCLICRLKLLKPQKLTAFKVFKNKIKIDTSSENQYRFLAFYSKLKNSLKAVVILCQLFRWFSFKITLCYIILNLKATQIEISNYKPSLMKDDHPERNSEKYNFHPFPPP